MSYTVSVRECLRSIHQELRDADGNDHLADIVKNDPTMSHLYDGDDDEEEGARSNRRNDNTDVYKPTTLSHAELQRLMMRPCLTPEEIVHVNRHVSPPVTHNVVVTLRINYEFDMHQLGWRLFGHHNLERFSAPVCLKIKSPHAACLIFASGEVIITGTKSVNAATLAAIGLVTYLSKISGRCVRYTDLQVQNRMATVYLGYTVNDEWLRFEHPEYVLNKKLFNATKIQNASVSCLLFKSGSLVITGPKTPEATMAARDEIIPILARYKAQEITRQGLETKKKAEDKEAVKAKQLLKTKHEIARTHQQRLKTKIKLYSRVSPAALPYYRGLVDITLGYCFAPSEKKPFCQHHAWVHYPDSPVGGNCIGKMEWPMIVQLYAQNGLKLPPHNATIATGSPSAKKRPNPLHPKALPIRGWTPVDGLCRMPHHDRLAWGESDPEYPPPVVVIDRLLVKHKNTIGTKRKPNSLCTAVADTVTRHKRKRTAEKKNETK